MQESGAAEYEGKNRQKCWVARVSSRAARSSLALWHTQSAQPSNSNDQKSVQNQEKIRSKSAAGLFLTSWDLQMSFTTSVE